MSAPLTKTRPCSLYGVCRPVAVLHWLRSAPHFAENEECCFESTAPAARGMLRLRGSLLQVSSSSASELSKLRNTLERSLGIALYHLWDEPFDELTNQAP